ncbi:MAG: ABC transporter substrate-binding protein [Spirochaetota bacterium]
MKKLALCMLLVLALPALVFAGGQAEGESQKASGPIIVGSNSAPRTLNPLYFPSRQDSIVTNMVYDNFVEPNEEGIIVGQLAESFDISDDGVNYTFELAEGVTWHDGEDFNGEDVVATFEMLAHPDYDGGVDRVGQIVGVEEFKENPENNSISGVSLSDDKMTVYVEITEASATFLPGLYFQILPEHHIKNIDLSNLGEADFNSNPVGTGPFEFVEWNVGDSIRLEKNEDYFLGEPKVSSVIIKFGELVSLMTQLQSGQIDILEVKEEGYSTFKGDPNFELYNYPMLSVDYVGYRTGPGRADDTDDWLPVFSKTIRQALAYATNKEALVDGAFGATGYPHDSIFPKNSLGDSPNDENYDYNVDKAKSMIESEGYEMNDRTDIYEKDGEPLVVEMLYSEADGAQAAILKEQWKAAGVQVDLKLLDFGALIDVLLRKSDADGNLAGSSDFDSSTASTDANFEAYLLGFAQESDPDEYAQYFVDDPFWNFYHYDNEDVQKWFEQQAVAIDQEKRMEILHKISEQITEDLPWFTYAGENETVVTGNNIGGFDPDTRGYTLNSHEWYIK